MLARASYRCSLLLLLLLPESSLGSFRIIILLGSCRLSPLMPAVVVLVMYRMLLLPGLPVPVQRTYRCPSPHTHIHMPLLMAPLPCCNPPGRHPLPLLQSKRCRGFVGFDQSVRWFRLRNSSHITESNVLKLAKTKNLIMERYERIALKHQVNQQGVSILQNQGDIRQL